MIAALEDFPLEIGDVLYKVYRPEGSTTDLYKVKKGTVCGIMAYSFNNDVQAQVRVSNIIYTVTNHLLGKSYFVNEDDARADALKLNTEILNERAKRAALLKERKENITVDMLLDAIRHCTTDNCEDCPLLGIKECDEFWYNTLETLLNDATVKEGTKEIK